MATDHTHAAAVAPVAPQGPQLSPAVRKRLQSWYTHGQEKAHAGSWDYASDMFSQCVEGDPTSLEYMNSFLHALHKKYKDNKKGAGFGALKTSGIKGALKKAQAKKDWPGVVKQGVELLKINPWDSHALVHIAHACEAMHYLEAELAWLRAALDVDPKDPEVNRECALALAKQGHFDQAIVCWARVEKAKPHDEEAQRQISELQVRKTETQLQKRNEAAANAAAAEAQAAASGKPVIKLTRQQELQKTIAENPANIEAYLELAEIHARDDRYTEAERILRTALEASGNDLRVQELYEDIGLRKARHQVAIAEQRAERDKSEEAQQLHLRMKQELNRLETEVFRKRVERYPAVTTWKVELGVRLKRAGNFAEAIKVLQEARNDARRRGLVLLELGECFQQIKQYKLAMSHYQEATEALSERELDLRKKALYRAGVLAMGLEDLDAAEKYLHELAGLDFSYRDVAERLDKISQVRNKG